MKEVLSCVITLFLLLCGALYAWSVDGKVNDPFAITIVLSLVMYGLYSIVYDTIEWIDSENEKAKNECI